MIVSEEFVETVFVTGLGPEVVELVKVGVEVLVSPYSRDVQLYIFPYYRLHQA